MFLEALEVATDRSKEINEIVHFEMELSDFQNAYAEFCSTEGLKELRLEDEAQLLSNFGLRIIYKKDNSTKAFTNIRWKSNKEKQNVSLTSSNYSGDLVEHFLATECVFS